MAKAKTAFVCSDCGASALQWFGTCPSCGAVGTLTETVTERAGGQRFASVGTSVDPVALSRVHVAEVERIPTGIGELDRVLGGGLVAGQVVLIGGDPGIGKSTLLLQALAALAVSHKVLYITGEESAQQVA
ncbi:MAG: ATPase domain-containing protein, partial [Burkholderiales bacterium]